MKKKFLIGVILVSACLMTACGSKEVKKTDEKVPVETENVTKKPQPEIKIDELIIEADGKQIFGKLHAPNDDEKHPAIIMAHGYNGSHADFLKECSYFARNGYVAYTFDFCGGSTRSKSSGKSTDMTIFTEKEDMLAVFDYISAMDNVDPEQVYLFGGSQGGLVTALAAEERADKVKAVALYFPAFNIPDDWRNNYKTESEIPEAVDFWGLQLGKKFFMDMRDFYTFDNIGEFSNKVLILQGDRDAIVPLAVAERAKEVYKQAEVVVLPGEGHGFTPAAGQKAMEMVLEFMKNQ